MIKLLLKTLLIVPFLILSCEEVEKKANFDVVPLPQHIEYTDGDFTLNEQTEIVYTAGDSLLEFNAQLLKESIKELTGIDLQIKASTSEKKHIYLGCDFQHENKEAYNILVTSHSVNINGSSAAGNFYGVQTLIKAIAPNKTSAITLPAVKIEDYPRFAYRGLMLDVGRRFYSVDFVKKYIDILSMHNMNVFHWHLTEDQGWRIKINKLPELTDIGSKRKQTRVDATTGNYIETDEAYGPYFYTQDEIKEVVAYAKQRYVTVIPEVDIPGHMLAALSSYPELGCTGGPYQVATTRGVFEDVLCVGNEKTFSFLEQVFDEIIELFPSEYIHIGGDECPKTRWKNCQKCQNRANILGLTNQPKNTIEHQLQSYFITRIEKYLNSKGKKIIGWDEILEGGLAPNATVMSWRGTKGGIDAAKLGHNVIMTPSQYMYFDYYQARDISNEPFSIGNYLPVRTVYEYEPYDKQLTEEQCKYILGVQANLWTEYISDEKIIEYMLLPRIDALSEVQWTVPDKKDFSDFSERMKRMLAYYDFKKYNYAKHVYDVEISNKATQEGIEIQLDALKGANIFYTTDGSEPTKSSNRYNMPILISKSCTIKARAFYEDGVVSTVTSKDINISKATNKKITLNYKPSPRWTFEGESILVDGSLGNSNYTDGTWLGFHGTDIDATIDLGKPETVSIVSTNTYHRLDNRIFGATSFAVYGSTNGVDFDLLANKNYPILQKGAIIGNNNLVLKFLPKTYQYIRIVLGKTDKIPDWHISAGGIPFLFIDEVIIN